MGLENRIAKRIESQMFISFSVLNEMGSPMVGSMGLALNISRTGVMLENRNEIGINRRLALEVAVGDDTMKVKGIVKYSKAVEDNYHIGIHFLDLRPDEVALLEKYYPDI